MAVVEKWIQARKIRHPLPWLTASQKQAVHRESLGKKRTGRSIKRNKEANIRTQSPDLAGGGG
jgi:hypothetical protein